MTKPDPLSTDLERIPDEQKGLRRLLAEREALEKGYDVATAERIGLRAERLSAFPWWLVAAVLALVGSFIARDREAFVPGLCVALAGTFYIVGRLLVTHAAKIRAAQLRALGPPPRADRPVGPDSPTDP